MDVKWQSGDERGGEEPPGGARRGRGPHGGGRAAAQGPGNSWACGWGKPKTAPRASPSGAAACLTLEIMEMKGSGKKLHAQPEGTAFQVGKAGRRN